MALFAASPVTHCKDAHFTHNSQSRSFTHNTVLETNQQRVHHSTNSFCHNFITIIIIMMTTMISPMEIPTTEDYMVLWTALRSEKVVRFAPMVSSSPAHPLAFEELKDFWYSPHELSEFRHEARRASPEERGMEYATPQRQKHRMMTIRCTLSAARKGLGEEQLSLVARKCTRWNQEIAFAQGCHDYASVYDPKLLSIIPPMTLCSSPPEFPFAMKRSTTTSCGASATVGKGACSSSRRVRRRVQ
jgi:hypothetical protein